MKSLSTEELKALKRKLIKLNKVECERDLFEFGKRFFPDYMKAPSADFHKELTSMYQDAILNNSNKMMDLAAPRGNAKSVWSSLILPIWSILYKHKTFVILISDSSDQADTFLGNIKQELEENPLIIEAFGEMKGEPWHQSKIVLANGGQMQSLGVGKKLRGARRRQDRPDLVILDDVENDENVESLDQRNKWKRWFNRAVLNAGDSKTNYIVVGTILHHDSLLSDLQINPAFKSKKFKAIIEFNHSPKWSEWERIFINLDNPNNLTDARAFYEDNEEEMTKGVKVLWQAKEDYYDLMVARLTMGKASFNSEKQNEPINTDDCLFDINPDDPKHWFDYDDINMTEVVVRGACDPSMGKNMDRGDYSALLTGAKHKKSGYIYILDADIERRHPDKIIDDMTSKTAMYTYNLYGVEDVAFQEYFKDAAVRKVRELGLDRRLPIVGIANTQTKKSVRIQSLQPLIANGTIKFHKSQKRLLEQLRFYPKVAHDDGCDALEMLVRMFKTSGDKMRIPDKKNIKRRGLSRTF